MFISTPALWPQAVHGKKFWGHEVTTHHAQKLVQQMLARLTEAQKSTGRRSWE